MGITFTLLISGFTYFALWDEHAWQRAPTMVVLDSGIWFQPTVIPINGSWEIFPVSSTEARWSVYSFTMYMPI